MPVLKNCTDVTLNCEGNEDHPIDMMKITSTTNTTLKKQENTKATDLPLKITKLAIYLPALPVSRLEANKAAHGHHDLVALSY